jgi:hypothetical protein
MASIRNEIALRAGAADVWDALRDFGALATRLVPGFVTDCKLDGDARIVTFFNGLVARELLVDRDDAHRRLAYAIVGGRATHYNASAQVFEVDERNSTLVWIIDLLPDEVAEPVRAMAAQGAAAMKKHFNGA